MRAYERKYQYDKLGNVEQVKQLGTNGFTRDFSYFSGKNTLEKIENPTPATIQVFTYDDAGNQITAGSNRNYVWNAANQLITYYNQAGGSDPTIFAQYDYNGGGERVSKLVRTGSAASPIYERVIYIDGIFEYHILENGSTYEKNYVHVMDDKSRIAMVRVGTPFPDDISDAITYNLEDQIGSSTVRLNTSGAVIDKEEYYPFGDSSLRTFSKKRYRYVGKEKDIESGLYYYGARYYAAWTCRFISIDPMAADYAHLTPYNNAGNKPINSVDIDGMQGESETKSESGGGQEGGGSVKKGDTIVDDDGKPHIVSIDEAEVTGTKIDATKVNYDYIRVEKYNAQNPSLGKNSGDDEVDTLNRILPDWFFSSLMGSGGSQNSGTPLESESGMGLGAGTEATEKTGESINIDLLMAYAATLTEGRRISFNELKTVKDAAKALNSFNKLVEKLLKQRNSGNNISTEDFIKKDVSKKYEEKVSDGEGDGDEEKKVKDSKPDSTYVKIPHYGLNPGTETRLQSDESISNKKGPSSENSRFIKFDKR